MSLSTNSRILALSTQGLTPSQISSIVGLSPSRISQVLSSFPSTESSSLPSSSSPSLSDEKDSLDLLLQQEQQSLSVKYLSAESMLLNQLTAMAPAAEFTEVTAALRVVSQRQIELQKLQAMHRISQTQAQQATVTITIPLHSLQVPDIMLTQNREVSHVGDRSLAPLTSDAVRTLFSSPSTQETSHQETSHEYSDTEEVTILREEFTTSPSPNAKSAIPQTTEPSAAGFLSFLTSSRKSYHG